jgi:hypothetical protein
MLQIPRESKAHFTFSSETFMRDEARSMDSFWARSNGAGVDQPAPEPVKSQS